MEIKTKYNIGDRVWIVYEPSYRNANNVLVLTGEVAIYDTLITSIAIEEDGLEYCCNDDTSIELKEKDIIPYEDKEKLLQAIEEAMQIIHKRENGNL